MVIFLFFHNIYNGRTHKNSASNLKIREVAKKINNSKLLSKWKVIVTAIKAHPATLKTSYIQLSHFIMLIHE
tara:strand:+ start:87787 stop:88002 length:216 start_codon:yes stop_codon:yes gene_type:complete